MTTKLGILPAKGSIELYKKLNTLAKTPYDAYNCWIYIQRKGKAKFTTELSAYIGNDDISNALYLFTLDFPQINLDCYNLLIGVRGIFSYAYTEKQRSTFTVSILAALADSEDEKVPDISKSIARHLITSSPLNTADTTYIKPTGAVIKLPSYNDFVAFMTVVLPTIAEYFSGQVEGITFSKDENLPSLQSFMGSNYVPASAFEI